MKLRYIPLLCSLFVAGCGAGGGSSPAPPVPIVTPSPTPAGPLAVTPQNVALNASGATQTLTASETGYSGVFRVSAASACANIATAGPATSSAGASATFTITAGSKPGNCTISVTDASGQTGTVNVTVTLTQGSIQ